MPHSYSIALNLVGYLTSLFLLLSAPGAPAAERGRPRAGWPSSGVDVGIGLNWFTYEEHIRIDDVERLLGVKETRGKPKSEERGLTPGLFVTGTFASDKAPIGIRLGGRFGVGPHRYDGSRQNAYDSLGGQLDEGETPYGIEYYPARASKANLFLQAEALLVGAVPLGRASLMAGAGIESRIWYRRLTEGMAEPYRWVSFPVELGLELAATERLSLGPVVAYRFMFSGSMGLVYDPDESHDYADLGISAPDVILGNRNGLEVSLPVYLKLTDVVSLGFRPWVHSYGFNKSNVDTMTITLSYPYSQTEKSPFYEPASSSLIVGLDVAFAYRRRR